MQADARNEPQDQRLRALVNELLAELGEDVGREGLLRTPERVARSLRFLTGGYSRSPQEVIGDAIYSEKYNEMVMVKDIDLFSLCEHHLLPFYGRCHVAYLPDGKILGLSKVPRLVEVFSRRLQVQERLTVQIADTLMELLQPLGVAVVIEALHLCMAMRGVEKQRAYTVTSAMLGVFQSDQNTRSEFLSLIRHQPA
ncbi:MAG TPA: GTP cyclohydrolase I FolE [Acidobacteriota bacterium]